MAKGNRIPFSLKLASTASLLLAPVCSLAPAAAQPLSASADSAAVQIRPLDAKARARIDALIRQMTPEEKAGQLTNLFSLPYPVFQKKLESGIENGTIGNVLFVTDPAEVNRLQKIALERSRLKIPLMFGFDVIHGLTTIFPVPIAAAASWDPQMVEHSQAIAAFEARAIGIHWTFAPNADIARDPRWGRIVEGAGEDPYLGSAMAAAQVRGFQGPAIGTPGRVISGVKHFAGYGASLGGRDYDEVNLSDSELWNVYLPPFKAAVDAGAGNVMSAYMGLNGVPASGNRWLLTDVLRKEWGFRGFVVSDNNAVKDLQKHGLTPDLPSAAVRALDAGVDMEMATSDPAFPSLVSALGKNEISSQQLDASVQRVLEAKYRMGLFDKPYVDEEKATEAAENPEHLVAARIAAERSAVLLKNDGDLLPLNLSKLKSIAVIGPLADSPGDALGPWVFKQNKPKMSSILAGIKEKAGSRARVTYSMGVNLPPRLRPSPFVSVVGNAREGFATIDDDAGIAQAADAARAADVAVLVLGEGQDMVGEVASKSSLDLPGRQIDLLNAVVATGKPVVVLLMNARPLDMKDSKAQAILDIWYPGSAAGPATANLLFGDAVPGGKLPFTWPRNAGQIPMIYSRLTSMDPINADKRYWNESNKPVYPFGHGLSYSSFSYTNLKVDKPDFVPGGSVVVSVDLSNGGKRTADEVAQLYIHQRSGTAARPVRELKGFQRVTLKPGEKRTLRFVLGDPELRYWNAVSRTWVIDESEIDVAVGGDSDAAFTGKFRISSRQP
ncbi:Glycoside hydrolase family protein [Sphingobium herbicidovorans NBRC 16415]|uniref:beta-glucosidase n=2 Tax=Sphingobium herbicidovorans TaxID=76947 RepID=A0A086P7Z1_SPHHM|nr:beta-glucosidase BglX [Sphingobium herbicidovorans]KFG89509.1 Glycoside hydrolase family protein [Sphingobium herbicidovorans NBRC 16415]